jgi:hypothetical protein
MNVNLPPDRTVLLVEDFCSTVMCSLWMRPPKVVALTVDEIVPAADPPSGSKETPMAANVAEVFAGTNE